MDQKRLGKNGPDVSTVGLGCMGLSGGYGPVDEAESIAVIHAAIDAGITYFDTGDFYAMGHNEMLLGRALKGRRDQVKIGVKFGALRGPDGAFIGFDSRPVAARAFLAYSLRRLDTDYIDLYQAARVDPSLPYEETIGGIADLITAGYVRHLGVSEVSAATLRKAQAVHTVAALQIEYSLMSRGIEDAILPAARELGISITAYGILSRGLIGGTFGRGDKAAGDTRGHYPRFSDENLKRNRTMVQALDKIAAKRNVTRRADRHRLGDGAGGPRSFR